MTRCGCSRALLWWAGRGSEAATVGDRAIAVLEAFPDSRELAQALSGRAQLAMNGERAEEAIALGSRAVRLARRLDDAEIVAHGLTNVGTVLIGGPDTERGRALLEEAFVLATGVGEDDHAARALVNLSTSTLTRRRDDPRVDADVERALRFAAERELDGYVQYMLGIRANLRVRRGEWRGAEADARASLGLGEQFGVSQCPALIVLGRLQARRGDDEAGETLEEAWERAAATRELQRLAPAASARAEHAWLDGDLERTVAIARPAYELAALRGDAWARAELAFWLWRGGAPVEPQADDPRALRRSIAGRLARRGRGLGAHRLPVRARRGAQRGRRRGGAAGGAARVRRVRRGARRLAPAPPAARRRRAADPARAARRLALRAGRPDAARDRGARPDRARGHQRPDRPGAGDHAQDGRPPRLRPCWRSSACRRGARPARPWNAG